MVPGQGPLESFRAGDAHKLPRTVGSHIGSENIHERPNGSVSAVTAGQSDSCSIHQQHGGHGFLPADKSLQSPVDVGSIQGYCTECRVHSRDHELCGRHRVQDPEGSDRLEAPFPGIQNNKPEFRAPGGGPV